MKEYIRPRMEVEQFDVEDIITSSDPETVMNGNDEGMSSSGETNPLLTN